MVLNVTACTHEYIVCAFAPKIINQRFREGLINSMKLHKSSTNKNCTAHSVTLRANILSLYRKGDRFPTFTERPFMLPVLREGSWSPPPTAGNGSSICLYELSKIKLDLSQ